MYKVVRYFRDLQDDNYLYHEGDTFPRDGLSVSEERIKELSSVDNKQHTVLIKEIAEEKTYTKTEINRMNKETLVNKAKEIGVEGAEEMSGNALKDLLIEHYNL